MAPTTEGPRLSADALALCVAELAVHAINHLDGEGEDPDGGCCPDCCAPCHALYVLEVTDQLTATIAPFVNTPGNGNWVWLRPDGSVAGRWLSTGWRQQRYHPDHDQPAYRPKIRVP